MEHLLKQIKNCTICEAYLPLGCRPIVTADTFSKIAIIGQTPGLKVHNSGIPWDDKSGDRLREWLNVSRDDFYNPELVALIPMGFCYPGKGKSGDLPPRPECAPEWHGKLFNKMNHLELTLIVGRYAQTYYLNQNPFSTLTETVRHFKDFLPNFFVLPHPSPRNNIWLKKNPWFEDTLLPVLKQSVSQILNQ